MAASRHRFSDAAGLLVWSIVPIALAYHFAHYLTALLVNGQYALVALSDPFALGWNLFGTADMQVERRHRHGLECGLGGSGTARRRPSSAAMCWRCWSRTGLPDRLHPKPPRAAASSQFPLTMLMIAYTVFGLWLLSTPTAG